MEFLKQVQASLESLNGYQMPYSVRDFLVLSKSTDQLLIKEVNDEAEVLVCLQESRIERLSTMTFPKDFHLDLMPDLGVVIEELSHFNTYCLSALKDREISPLELEVQGEVDRFGVALDFLFERNEENLKEHLFDSLFSELKTQTWVSEAEKERYKEAHHIARNFCRSILGTSSDREALRTNFKAFFEGSSSQKLTSKY